MIYVRVLLVENSNLTVVCLAADMSIGKDGITDCTYVCNPENFMQWSCNEYCPGTAVTEISPVTKILFIRCLVNVIIYLSKIKF